MKRYGRGSKARPKAPMLNASHPLAGNCVFFTLLNAEAGLIDISKTPVSLALNGSSSQPQLRPGLSGNAMYFPPTSGYWAGGNGADFTALYGLNHPLVLSKLQDRGGLMLYMRAAVDPYPWGSNTYPRIIELTDNGGVWARDGWVLELDPEGAGGSSRGAIAFLTNGSANARRIVVGPTTFDGKMHDYVLFIPNIRLAGGGNLFDTPAGLYVDTGEFISINDTHGNMTFFTNQTGIGLRIGNRPDRQRTFPGTLEMLGIFAIFDSEFHDDAAWQLLDDPLSLITTGNRVAYDSPPSTTGYEAHRHLLVA